MDSGLVFNISNKMVRKQGQSQFKFKIQQVSPVYKFCRTAPENKVLIVTLEVCLHSI